MTHLHAALTAVRQRWEFPGSAVRVSEQGADKAAASTASSSIMLLWLRSRPLHSQLPDFLVLSVCVCGGGGHAHMPAGAHTAMCLWTRTIQFGQPWTVVRMKGTESEMSPLKWRRFKAHSDFWGLVHWSFPKQFLVAERAVPNSSWKHFSEPCSWIQIITCVCLCVCTCVCVCGGVTLPQVTAVQNGL